MAIKNTMVAVTAIIEFLMISTVAIHPLYGYKSRDAFSIVSSRSSNFKLLPSTMSDFRTYLRPDRLSKARLHHLNLKYTVFGNLSSGTIYA